MRAAKKLGIKIQDERLKLEMQAFANRANLTINEFAKRLENQESHAELGKFTCKYQFCGSKQ